MFLASTEFVYLVFAFVGIAAVVIVAYFLFSPTQRAKRRFKKTPLKNISECKYHRGPMRIQGHLEYINPPLTAPMSKRDCAYFEFKVEQKKSSGKNSYWKDIIKHSDGGDFAVVDDTGKAIIQLDLGTVLLTQDRNLSSGTFNDASPQLEAVLESFGETSKGWVFNKTLRYTEGVLEQGEKVSVSGVFTRDEVRDLTTGQTVQQPVFSSDEKYQMVVTDNPKLSSYKGGRTRRGEYQ